MNVKMSEGFYMTLPSNVKNSHFENTVANFKTELPHVVNLEEDWLVGLAGISYTHSWYNLIEEEEISVHYFDNSKTPALPRMTSFYLPKGKYKKIQDLLGILDMRWHAFVEERKGRKTRPEDKLLFDVPITKFENKEKPKPLFTYHGTENRVIITLPKFGSRNIYFSFSEELCSILGFDKKFLDERIGKQMIEYSKEAGNRIADQGDSKQLYKYDTLTADRPFTMHHVYYGLYVYCNVIRPTFVGDTKSQLLRFVEIPTNSDYGDQIVLSYPDTHYHPLMMSHFKEIEIDIKDEYGNPFPFEFGRSIVILHFMKNQ